MTKRKKMINFYLSFFKFSQLLLYGWNILLLFQCISETNISSFYFLIYFSFFPSFLSGLMSGSSSGDGLLFVDCRWNNTCPRQVDSYSCQTPFTKYWPSSFLPHQHKTMSPAAKLLMSTFFDNKEKRKFKLKTEGMGKSK